MRILMVIHDVTYGAGKMMLSIANDMADRGYDITLLTYGGTKRNPRLDERVRWIPQRQRSKIKLLQIPTNISAIKRAIQETKPDVTLSFLTNANFMNAIASKACKVPAIVSERGDPYSEDGFLSRIKKCFFGWAQLIICQSENAAEYYAKKHNKNIIVIPNYIELRKDVVYPQFSERANNILVVGRLDIKQKRQDLAIKAFKQLSKNREGLRLVLIGDGPDQNKLKNLTKELDISDRVIFAGKSDDVPSDMLSSKYFLLSSDFEGMPNSLLEAMAYGMVSVTTDFSPGNAKEIVNHGVNGYITKRSDWKAISDTFETVLNDTRNELVSSEAKRIAEKYNKERILEMWSAAFEKYKEQ